MARFIPKIIHYCWFGGNEKGKEIENYISGWKSMLSEYTFMEWTENNFDISSSPLYVQQAYKAKKYAFVSDYVRLVALSNFGGIYFDTDIEVLKPFDELLNDRLMVLCFESEMTLETAFIACKENHPIINRFLATYHTRSFINDDGTYDLTDINRHFSDLMNLYGLDLKNENFQLIDNDTIAVYPREYFSGFDVENWHVKKTENTRTVHHMNSSWGTSKLKMIATIIKILQNILGYDLYDAIKKDINYLKKKARL